MDKTCFITSILMPQSAHNYLVCWGLMSHLWVNINRAHFSHKHQHIILKSTLSYSKLVKYILYILYILYCILGLKWMPSYLDISRSWEIDLKHAWQTHDLPLFYTVICSWTLHLNRCLINASQVADYSKESTSVRSQWCVMTFTGVYEIWRIKEGFDIKLLLQNLCSIIMQFYKHFRKKQLISKNTIIVCF